MTYTQLNMPLPHRGGGHVLQALNIPNTKHSKHIPNTKYYYIHDLCDFPCNFAENIFLSTLERFDRLNGCVGDNAGVGADAG